MAKMQAVRIHRFGGPAVLQPETIDRPEPGPGELLLRIEAASVNPVDFKMRDGGYPAAKEEDLPLILGRDLSGTVESVGANGDGHRPGTAVFAFLAQGRGAYAEYVIAKPEEVAPKPEKLSHAEAAAIPLAALTAWQGLFDHGQLASGQRVLIHGGAGGVGHLAIQFAKHRGATVITTASATDEEFLRELGADQIIDYKNERFEDKVTDIDLVYDLIGGDTQNRSWSVLKPGGRLVSTLGKADNAPQDREPIGYMAEPRSEQLAQIGSLIDQGRVTVKVQKTFPLAQAGEAQDYLEHQHVQGKVVLDVAT